MKRLRLLFTPGARALHSGSDIGLIIGLFLFWSTSYGIAVCIFVQFTPLEILRVTLAFLGFIGVLVVVLLHGFFPKPRMDLNPVSISFGILLALILIVTSISWLDTGGINWQEYYPTFPLLELELLGKFHPDAVFHTSLIQSISDFGYPSTGQHDAPFVSYHVLSHYVDAALHLSTGTQAYAAYGLFWHFKVTVVISAITLFLWVAIRRTNSLILLVTLMFVTPVILSDWTLIGSQGLWVPTLLTLLASPKLYRVLSSPNPRNLDFIFIFFLVALVGLGKVSSGAMLASLVSILLLLRFYKHWQTYVTITALGAFFALYWRYFTYGPPSAIEKPSLGDIRAFLNPATTYSANLGEPNLIILVTLVFILATSSWLFVRLFSAQLAVAISGTLLLLSALVSSLPNLTQPDVFYFIHGLTFPGIILSIISISSDLARPLRGTLGQSRQRAFKFTILLCVILATLPMRGSVISSASVWTRSPSELITVANHNYFRQINTAQSAGSPLGLTDRSELLKMVNAGSQLELFNEDLDSFMVENDVTRKNSVFFIPRELLENIPPLHDEPKWAGGMLIYAITGVPLIHGILDPTYPYFGQSAYGEEAKSLATSESSLPELCTINKTVIELKSWSPVSFELPCRG